MANINVEQRNALTVGEMHTEFVERKGVGHPDSLIDGIAERVSEDLSKAYIKAAGTILHHNVDKGLIVAGSSTAEFGKATITVPIEIIVAGRATTAFQGIEIPVDEIAIKSTRDYLKEHTRFLDLESEVEVVPKIFKGSADLGSIFSRSSEVPLANDTSFGIGFAPFTETERLTFETEKFLNSKEYKTKMPMLGEDIKVMGVRDGDKITLTIAIAFVAHLISSMDEYVHAKEQAIGDVKSQAKKYTQKEVDVVINNGDSREKGHVYLTKSGLSCEAGDDGEVGRGNRINGIITPFRHMSLEAAAGKNPVNHVGKIYSVLSNKIAYDVLQAYPDIKECNVSIVSQIGRRIDDPKSLHIGIVPSKGGSVEPIASKIQGIAQATLDDIQQISIDIANGKYSMF